MQRQRTAKRMPDNMRPGQLSIDSSPDRGSDGQWVAGTRVIPGGTMTGIFESSDAGQIQKLRRNGKP